VVVSTASRSGLVETDRRIGTMRRTLIVGATLALASLATSPAAAEPAAADLTTWEAASYPGDGSPFADPGAWNVAPDGLSVTQTVNGAPTFFAGGSSVGQRLTVTFTTPAGDNDFLGVALGFDPLEIADPDADYLLIDWKQSDQQIDWLGGGGPVVGREGLAVSRVTGIPNLDEMWGHVDQVENPDGGLQELARGATLGTVGWSDTTAHAMTIEYTATELRVWVDDGLEIDLAGDFPAGPFALYDFSQPGVQFSAITFEDLNGPPEVIDGGAADVAVSEGETAATGGGFVDPDGDPLVLGCSGSCDGFVDAGDGTWSWSQLQPEGPAAFTVTVTASDGELAATDDFTVTVSNLPPEITTATLVSQDGLAVSVAADFTDAGVEDTHTALWTWGDGATTPGVVSEVPGSGTTTADHDYGAAGYYTVSVTVVDDDGGTDTARLAEIFVFDPDIFVTGGGWVTSPPGAFVAVPDHTGKATFGFVVRYDRTGAVRGNLQLQVHKGIALHATAFDHLLIADGVAEFAGSGKVNGEPGYDFVVVATDERFAASAEDRFRATITRDGTLVYDGSFYPAGGLPIVGKGIQIHTRG
jgi:hypothetical protein